MSRPIVRARNVARFFIFAACFTAFLQGPAAASETAPIKILHVMSYHTPWAWTDEQLAGFLEGLGGLNVDLKVFQMDTKRHSSAEWIEKVSAEARDLTESWQPDLIYTNDDHAQKFYAKELVGSETPVVFSGVNADPREYGFVGSPNVTGVLEQEHFVQSVELLRKVVPGVRRIAVVLDSDQTWSGVVARMVSRATEIPDLEIVSWDFIETFREYKEKMAAYEGTVDAVALLGIFNFKDDAGEDVPYVDVLRWTAENSTLPDFSFWQSRVEAGTLVAVTVSGHQQGLAAGRMARAILTGERKPSDIPMEPTVKGKPSVSLARANKLGIRIPSSVLLNSDVVKSFEWETVN